MKDIFSLEGKNIMITGASSGIGRQCAISCSQMGANIIMIGRDADRLEQTLAALNPGNHRVYAADITDYEAIALLVADAVSQVGKVAGFIHAAGIELTLPLKNTKPANFEQAFAVNVIAGFEMAKILSAKKYFPETGSSFVFISSIMGVVGEMAKVVYSSSKGALIAGVKSMALELALKKIRVNSISPAMVETEMAVKLFDGIGQEAKNQVLKLHPLGMGKPEDIAAACIFLLADSARWITGTNLIIDGGYSAK